MERPAFVERETTVQEVLAYFAKLTRKHEGYTSSKSAFRSAAAFLKWCKQYDVRQPLLFVWLRFCIVRSGHRAQSAHPSLVGMASEVLLPQYVAIAERQRFERELAAQFATQRERGLVGVHHGHEAVRRDYVVMGRSDMCEAQLELSGGYHPFSTWCPACPRAITCAAKTNAEEGIDVVALRLGRISPEQAHASRRRTA